MRYRPLTEQQLKKKRDAQIKRTRSSHLAGIIEQNIQIIHEMRQEFEQSKSLQDRIADAITAFAGSMTFAYLHILWFGGWIGVNLRWFGIKPFDPFPFGLLTMIVSLEAIFLATFVLVSQNRMSLVADQRADLDLQINFLAEHEITRLLNLVTCIAKKLDVLEAQDPELPELQENVSPEQLAERLKEEMDQPNA